MLIGDFLSPLSANPSMLRCETGSTLTAHYMHYGRGAPSHNCSFYNSTICLVRQACLQCRPTPRSCRCNNRKSDCHPRNLRSIGMSLAKYPYTPSFHELQTKARMYPPSQIHETWEEFLYFEREIKEDEQGAETVA